MLRKIPFIAGLFGVLLLVASSALAQAPLDIIGITDQSHNSYTYQVPFRVPSVSGYSYLVTLDGKPVPTDVTVTVNTVEYHEVSVWRTNLQTGAVANRLVRFIVVDPARGGAENGIPPWVPYPTIDSTAAEFAEGHLRLIAPLNFPAGYPVPVVAWVENDQGHAIRANGRLESAGHPSIRIKRGVGSGFLGDTNLAGALTYSAHVKGLEVTNTINLESGATWTSVSGTIGESVTWPANSRIYIASDLIIPAGSTLTVEAGAIVAINYHTDITNSGRIVINGTTDRPVVFMPKVTGQPWGGIVQHANNASLTATGTIFTGSGAQALWFDSQFGAAAGPHSHRGEQALFSLIGVNNNVTFTDCAAIYLSGQLGHAVGGSGNSYAINMTHFLMQRTTTGGEFTGAKFTINDSAFIECSSLLNQGEYPNFVDGDNDGLYIVDALWGSHGITNTLIGWTQDDGVDSGGSGAGILNWQNCWLESIYHEANSLSGTSKDSRHYGDVIMNNGQAIESGYEGPIGRMYDCLLLANNIGLRYGDNYQMGYSGFLWSTNTISLYNYRDVWGMEWSNWRYGSNSMDIRSNIFTAANALHPSNTVWNPTADAWRLTKFMTIPPTAAVGLGFAVWTNQFAMSNIFSGVPVRLSSFTTNFVTVNYSFTDNLGQTLASSSITFSPGETLKKIIPAGFDVSGQSEVRVILNGASNGELTGATSVTFLGSVTAPQVSLRISGTQVDSARMGEGLAAKLSGPSSETVSVDYRWEAAGQLLASGVVTFDPGQTLQWIPLPGINPQSYDLFYLALSNPTHAQLAAPSAYYFIKTPALPTATSPTFVQRGPGGSLWKYLDTVTSAVPNWQATNFSDSAWTQGRSSLGYGNSPSQTTTVGYGPSSTAKYITTYFRNSFNVTNTVGLTSLTINLLRDDGAVVYLNGAELFRDNMPAAPTLITYTNLSSTNYSGTATIWYSRTFALSALPVALRDGTNVVAVEIHQSGAGSSDILFDLEVIGNPVPLAGSQPSVYWGKFDQTNFVLGWSDATYVLEQATNVAGPYTNAVLASPLSINPTNPQKYFRLRK